jgi:uncharacterized lipoprotein NlpE involved in copper resistance
MNKHAFSFPSTALLLLVLLHMLLINVACSSQNQEQQRSQSAINSTLNNPDPAHNSQNSLDWAGMYDGLLPCADCPGISTKILLNKDLTYLKWTKYEDRSDSYFLETGHFEWSKNGGTIVFVKDDSLLDKAKKPTAFYRVVENGLIQLDIAGNSIESELADHYRLEKRSSRLGDSKVLLGTFKDDYDLQYRINEYVWEQWPNATYYIIEWHEEEGFFIAHNAKENTSGGLLWSRFDWVYLSEEMQPYIWGFCMGAYKESTSNAALQNNIADHDNPKTGCNGFPFSRMKVSVF